LLVRHRGEAISPTIDPGVVDALCDVRDVEQELGPTIACEVRQPGGTEPQRVGVI
jgi:hypothetical protein